MSDIAIPRAYPLPVPNGCVLYFDMQDSGARIIDHSGRRNHGTAYGSIPSTGMNGLVRAFDGVDDRIALPTLAGFPRQREFSLEFVLSAEALGSTRYIFLAGSAGEDGIELRLNGTTNRVEMRIIESFSVKTGPPSEQLSVGQCTHILAVSESARMVMYQNGMQVGSPVTNNQTPGNIANPVIGTDGGSGDWHGTIGLARVYNRALSAFEAQAAYGEVAWQFGLAE